MARDVAVGTICRRFQPQVEGVMSPEVLLGPALATAVRELVRQEIEARPAASAPPVRRTLTVPEASKVTGVSVETIRGLIHGGRLPARLAGANPNPKRPTFLVYADEVLTALDRPAMPAVEPVNFQEKAATLRARVERRRE